MYISSLGYYEMNEFRPIFIRPFLDGGLFINPKTKIPKKLTLKGSAHFAQGNYLEKVVHRMEWI
jgi:hypothetical protein